MVSVLNVGGNIRVNTTGGSDQIGSPQCRHDRQRRLRHRLGTMTTAPMLEFPCSVTTPQAIASEPK
ncbi:MAG: hypothetical protein WDN06_02310 [Asticcacaulis sp.]